MLDILTCVLCILDIQTCILCILDILNYVLHLFVILIRILCILDILTCIHCILTFVHVYGSYYIIVCCTQCAGVNEDGFPGMFSSPQRVIIEEPTQSPIGMYY